MALVRTSPGTSSDSNIYGGYRYDVFLSFRGEDTRKTFTDHLYTALNEAGFLTFRDDDEVERGEDIKLGLQKAIQLSRASVVVFSKNYASSRWCLDELVLILERKRTNSDHVVLPVFYDVDPFHVRKQTGNIGKAFTRHQEIPSPEKSPEKVEGWRKALAEIADLGGMVLQNEADGSEAKFITKIVKAIGDELSRTPLSVEPKLIGIQSQAERIKLWLQDGSSDVGILVVYGMSGIGKTTIAKYVYNLNFISFEGSSFIENIKETADQPNGLVQIQMQLLSDILKGRKLKIYSVSEGIIRIADAISSRRVLLVLDDVDHRDQLDAVLRMKDRFYPGSKIIITTRRKRLLKAHEGITVHEVGPLDDNESLELFSWHAFGQDHPIEEYMELSRMVVKHGGGLPLALKILGSSLSGESISVWESELEKLKVIPHGEIMNELRKRFDSDPEASREKNANSTEWIFLVTSLCMEILSAACDQASSPSRPRYALFGMLLAIAALLTSIWELIYKGMKKNVVRGKRECHMPFGSDIELFALVGGITQCVCSIIQYVCYIRRADNPIKMSLLPAIFLICVIATRISRKRMPTTYETGEHTT